MHARPAARRIPCVRDPWMPSHGPRPMAQREDGARAKRHHAPRSARGPGRSSAPYFTYLERRIHIESFRPLFAPHERVLKDIRGPCIPTELDWDITPIRHDHAITSHESQSPGLVRPPGPREVFDGGVCRDP